MCTEMSAITHSCRICFETGGELFCPCGCSGTMKWVHRECLQKWIVESSSNECELCKNSYNYTWNTLVGQLDEQGYPIIFARMKQQYRYIKINIFFILFGIINVLTLVLSYVNYKYINIYDASLVARILSPFSLHSMNDFTAVYVVITNICMYFVAAFGLYFSFLSPCPELRKDNTCSQKIQVWTDYMCYMYFINGWESLLHFGIIMISILAFLTAQPIIHILFPLMFIFNVFKLRIHANHKYVKFMRQEYCMIEGEEC